MNALPPAGWFPDPAGQRRLRYWDGAAWTAHFAPIPADGSEPVEQPKPQAPTRVSTTHEQYHYTSGTVTPVVSEVPGMGAGKKWVLGGAVVGLVLVIFAVAAVEDSPEPKKPVVVEETTPAPVEPTP